MITGRFATGAAPALLASFLVVGCNSGSEVDCSTSVRFEDTVYDGHTRVDQNAPTTATLLGQGEYLDCDGSGLGQEVAVYAVYKVDPSIAIFVKAEPYIYVAEDVPQSAWPEWLKKP